MLNASPLNNKLVTKLARTMKKGKLQKCECILDIYSIHIKKVSQPSVYLLVKVIYTNGLYLQYHEKFKLRILMHLNERNLVCLAIKN